LINDYDFQAFISCPIGIQKIGFVMAAYGASTTVFALLLSHVSKYTGRHALFGLAGVVNLGILIVLYVWRPSADQTYVIYVVPVVWGMAEGVWQTQSNGRRAIWTHVQLWPLLNIHLFTLKFNSTFTLSDKKLLHLSETEH